MDMLHSKLPQKGLGSNATFLKCYGGFQHLDLYYETLQWSMRLTMFTMVIHY